MHLTHLAPLAFACFVVAAGCSSSSDGDPGGATDSGATPSDTTPSDTAGDTATSADSTGGDSATTDAPAADTGGCDIRGTAPACNTLTGSGDFIVTQRVAEAFTTAPVAGTLAQGTYVLIKSTEYTGVGGATGPSPTKKAAKSTAFFGCGRYDQYYEEQGGTGFTINADGTIDGTSMKLHGTCPGVADSGFTISITATGFLANTVDSGGKGNVAEYVKK